MTHLSHPFVIPVAAGLLLVGAFVATEDVVTHEGVHPAWSEEVLTAPPACMDEVVEQYCVRCHNERRMRGNMSLETFSLETAGSQGDIAEKMIRKLRAGMMPPPGSRTPGGDSLAVLATALEERMDALATANPNPGSRTFQRLNRAEYRASVLALLGIDVDAGAFLPPDTKSANFDNIADVQTPSTTLM